MSDITTFVDGTSVNYAPTPMVATWPRTVDTGDDWVYPLENRGYRTVEQTANLQDFRPAIFAYSMIREVLKSVGYTFSSVFFETAKFKEFVISHYGNRFRHSEQTIHDNRVTVGNNTTQTGTDSTYNGLDTVLNYTNPLNSGFVSQFTWDEATSPNEDPASNFDPTAGTLTYGTKAGRFTAPITGAYKVKARMKGTQYNLNTALTGTGTGAAYLSRTTFLRRYDSTGTLNSGTIGYTPNHRLVGTVTGVDAPQYSTGFDREGEVEIYMFAGWTIELWELYHGYDTDPLKPGVDNYFGSWQHVITEIDMKVELQKHFVVGHVFDLADVVDDKISLLEIINDITRKFNLYWDTDNGLKKITVEPRDDFYEDITDAEDWTDRLDLLQPIITTYNSQGYKRQLLFKYAEDSNDGFVKGRNEDKNNVLAEYEHDLPDKFGEGQTVISTSQLAPTYWIIDDTVVPLDKKTLAPYTARLWKKYSPTMPNEEIIAKPRLLNYRYGEQLKGTVNRVWRFDKEVTDRTMIPYVMPHEIVINGVTECPAGTNLYWHDIGTQDGLFEDYYSFSMSEVRTGKGAVCTIIMDERYWTQFNFRKIVYFAEPLDLRGYWKVEAINNYQPAVAGKCKIKLLRQVEYEAEAQQATEEIIILGGEGSESSVAAPLAFPSGTSQSSSAFIKTTIEDNNGNFVIVNVQTISPLDGSIQDMTL